MRPSSSSYMWHPGGDRHTTFPMAPVRSILQQIFCLFGVGRSRIHTSERRDKAEHLVEDERYAESVCYEDFEEVDLS
uniref:Uncharacterized protein n=1 Tax=Steinernema glaseri TaxID=37863 RepID=A0A1I7ZR23_9BILA